LTFTVRATAIAKFSISRRHARSLGLASSMLSISSDDAAPEEPVIMKYDAYGNFTVGTKRPPRPEQRPSRPVISDRARRNRRRVTSPRGKLTAA
jgi:hypothetical protein